MMDVQPDYKLNTLKQLKNPVRQFNAVRLKSRFFGGFFGFLSGCTLAILLLFSVPFVQNARGQNRVGGTLTRDSVAATYSEETSLSDSLDRSALETPTGVSETVLSGENDTIPALSSDSLQVVPDSLANEEEKAGVGLEGINAVVEYQAEDSLIFEAGGMGRLYKQGQIVYEDLNLEADYIQMSMDSSLIYASGIEDSTGTVMGNPVFKDTSGEYISKNLKYNFNTRRGIINQVVTQQGEGYVVSGLTKKMEDDALYMVDGKYTTCDDHDNPHFYLQLSKAKVRPKKNIVAGPAHLVVEDVHLPLFIPFGFFPFTESYSSGIITPTYGDELSRGFYLKDGGYYFAISDYIDLALTGELYSKGSWGGRLRTNYRKRYKFSGALNASYLVSVTSERNLPDYAQSKNLSLTWSHSQDPKANPFRSFSASVNFATSGYSRNDIASYYNPEVFSTNTKSSSVNLTQRFPNFPLVLSASMSVSQRSKDSVLTVSLPNLTASVSRFYPFKRKNPVGRERFYEKISMSYTGSLANSISEVKEYDFFKKSLVRDWRNGMRHSIPVSATFNLLNYINITPSFSYTERWYSSSIDKYYDPGLNQLLTDTLWGFNRVWDYSASVSASTKLYGFFQPLPKLFGTKVNMIRHVLTPSVSLGYRPDFGEERYGYYKTIDYIDVEGNEKTHTYSRYQNSLYGTPGRGKSGTISFNVANNLEMKVRNDKDTINLFKKVSLIDNFSFGTSYNLAADSLNWSNISANIRIKFGDLYTLNLSGSFDPYTYILNSAGNPVRVNVTQFEKYGIPGRLVGTGTSFSYSINNDTFKKKDKEGKAKGRGGLSGSGSEPPDLDAGLSGPGDETEAFEEPEVIPDPEAALYQPFKMPWNVSLSYTLRYARANFNKERLEYDMKLMHNLSFNGNLAITDKWRFTLASSYNFNTKQLSTVNCTVSRDLHCWQMSASFIPVGRFKSYNFSIRVKSGMLQDLKYEQQQNPRDNVVWGIR